MRWTSVGVGLFFGAVLLVMLERYWPWIVTAIVLATLWKQWRKRAARAAAAREEARREIAALSERADQGDRDWVAGGSGLPGFAWSHGVLLPVTGEIERGAAKHRR